MSDCERIAHFWAKKERFARTTDERISSPAVNLSKSIQINTVSLSKSIKINTVNLSKSIKINTVNLSKSIKT